MPYDDEKLNVESRIQLINEFLLRTDVKGEPVKQAEILLEHLKI